VAALRTGLRDLGYVEGKNLTIDFRWAEGKHGRLPELAAELVRLKVDVIVAQGTPGASAAKQATATIPIVVPIVADPVSTGLVASLARPGGNVTGLTWFSHEVSAKRLELLRDALPRTRRVAVLINPDNPSNAPILRAMELAAGPLKLEIPQFGARGPGELEGVFAAMVAKRVDALTIIDDAMLIGNARAIATLAVRNRLPLIAFTEVVEAGGLMGYGASFPGMFQHAATYVDKILRGARPGDLPVERATKFELMINLKTARTLGLTIPPAFLQRADQLIE
jgi:putative ABC transport system substrate-binding protein